MNDFFTGCECTNVRIIEDKLEMKPKGFGYAEFATLDGLKQALTLNGTQFQGRNIRISVADPRKPQHVSKPTISSADLFVLQPRTETAQMQENLVTGAEKAHSPIYQTEVEAAVNLIGDLDPTLAEIARSGFQKAMARSAIFQIGSARVPYRLCLNKSVVQEKGVGHERTTAPRNSEIADRRQLRGVKVALKVVHKKAVQDRQDESSRNDQLSNEPPLPQNKIASGVLRCDLMLQRPSLRYHLARAAKLHLLLL